MPRAPTAHLLIHHLREKNTTPLSLYPLSLISFSPDLSSGGASGDASTRPSAQLPPAALFCAQAPGEATSPLLPMAPPPPTHTQLPLPPMVADLSGTPSVLVVRNEAGGLCSLSHSWRQQEHILNQTLIGLVVVSAVTQLLTKTEGHWKMSIPICLHHIKYIWIRN